MKKIYTFLKFGKNKSHPFWRWFWLTFLVTSLVYSFYVPSNQIAWAKNITSPQTIIKNANNNTLLFLQQSGVCLAEL